MTVDVIERRWSVEPYDPADEAPEGGEGVCAGEPLCDPVDEERVRAATVRALDASARGWGPGWPNAQVDKIVTLRRSDGVVLPVRREVAPMVAWLCDSTERLGYNLRPGECWGFANRPIRGTTTPSNHSWGLAVDINAPANPMGPVLVTDMPAWMPRLWAAHGWRWGGTYSGRPDAMHYEFMGTPADASAWRPPPSQPAPPARPEVDMAYRYRTGDGRIWTTDFVVTQHWEDPGPGFERMLAATVDLGTMPDGFHASLVPGSKIIDAVNYGVANQQDIAALRDTVARIAAKLGA